MKRTSLWTEAAGQGLLVIVLAGFGVGALLLALDLPPLAIIRALAGGTLGSWSQFTRTLSIWTPLLLCSSGLLFTFRAGLWNIGVEGQVIMGAIGATALLRLFPSLPPNAHLVLALAAALLAGGVWGLLAGLLKTRGGVNEIFGGLGLNFVAQGLIVYLIFGPWKRAGMASMSGTDLLDRSLWLSQPPGWQVAPLALGLALAGFTLTAFLLTATRFGLRVRAVGINPRAARLFGIRPGRYGLLAILLGGGLAGLAGGLQVTAVYHRLIPAVSSGYGYLGLLVVMLANYRFLPVPLIALFFAWLAAGSFQLPMVLQIDSSLSGVIQGACVLSALAVDGLRRRK